MTQQNIAVYLGLNNWWRWSVDGWESCRKHVNRRSAVKAAKSFCKKSNHKKVKHD